MRLTLRTLLAWTDGLLGPADRADLAHRIAASDTAKQLSQRIVELVARPSLQAPPPRGRGLAADANSVAEYLDNVLPADNLENYERICLDSDMHLAETAACHGILAELVRAPRSAADLPAGVRRRLEVGLGKRLVALPNEPQRDEAQEEVVEQARLMRAAIGLPDVVEVGPRATPAGPRRSPAVRPWVSAAVAVVLLLTVAGALVWSLGRGKLRQTARAAPVAPPPGTDAPPGAVEEPAGDVPAAADPPLTADDPRPGDAAPTPPGNPALGNGPEPSVAGDDPAGLQPVVGTPPPGATPPGGPTSNAAVASTTAPAPQPDPLVAGSAPPNPPPASPSPASVAGIVAATPPAQAVPPAPEPTEESPFATSGAPAPPRAAAPEPASVEVGDPAGLLRRDPGPPFGPWKACRKSSREPLGTEFVVPPHCFPEVTVGGLTIRLHPCSRARFTGDADGTPRLQLFAGRAVVSAGGAAAAVGISAGGLVGVARGGLTAPLGVERAVDRTAAGSPDTVVAGHARIIPPPEGTEWRPTDATGVSAAPRGADGVVRLPATVNLVWSAADPGVVQQVARADRPEWLGRRQPAERLEREAGRVLAGRLAAGGDVADVLVGMLGDTRDEHRMAAATTLALMGDPAAVVELLVEDSPRRRLKDGQWARFEAEAIPAALSAAGEAGNRFQQALGARAGAETGHTLWRMARGIGDDELAAGGAEFLVGALEAPQLAVRRYAIHALGEIVHPVPAAASRYQAERDSDGNREAVKWWRARLAAGTIRRAPPSPREAAARTDEARDAGGSR